MLALTLPAASGGSGLGPRTFAAVTATLAEADASVAMVYLMHVAAAATIAAARPGAAVAPTLQDIAAGRHLSTLAFSEAGSRSHFWSPVSRARRNGADILLTARKSWVTSAGHAQSYVVSSLSPAGATPINSTLYLVPAGAPGISATGPWDGLGLRANASAPMTLDVCKVPSDLQLTDDGAGFKAMLEVVLPMFNLGTAAVALGLCRAAMAGTDRPCPIVGGAVHPSAVAHELRQSKPPPRARSRGAAALGRTSARRLWIVARRSGASGLAQASGLGRDLKSAAPGVNFCSRATASHAQLKSLPGGADHPAGWWGPSYPLLRLAAPASTAATIARRIVADDGRRAVRLRRPSPGSPPA